MAETTPEPSKALYNLVRARLLENLGKTLAAWCSENKVHPSSMRNALLGASESDRSKELLARILSDAGLNHDHAG